MEKLTPPDYSSLDSLSADLQRVEALRDSAVRQSLDTECRVLLLDGEISTLKHVADLFRVLIDREVVDNAVSAQNLLTEGLQVVFDDLDLSVRAQVEVQRGKVSVDLVTIQKQADGTITEGSSTEAYGGSVSTVQSVLLRIVVISRRGLRPLLLLDESLGAVAEHYVPQVGQFLALLSDRLGFDILVVSHNPIIVEAAKHSYRISKAAGAASFKKIRTGKA